MFASDYKIFPKSWLFPQQGQKIKQYLMDNQCQMLFKPVQRVKDGKREDNILISDITQIDTLFSSGKQFLA